MEAELMTNILTTILQQSPLIALLVYILFQLNKKNEKKEEEYNTLVDKNHAQALSFIDAYSKISQHITDNFNDANKDSNDIKQIMNTINENVKEIKYQLNK